jgi:hypothetical protein
MNTRTHGCSTQDKQVLAGETVEFRGSMLGAIAAVAGTMSTIGLDFTHPVLAKDKFATSEGTKSAFSGAAGSQGEGMEKLFDVIVGCCIGRRIQSEEFGAKQVDGTQLINAKEQVFRVGTDLGIGKSFRGKVDSEGCGGGIHGSGIKSSTNFVEGAVGRGIVHRDDEGAKVLAFGTALAGTESRGERAGANVRDVGATADRARGEFQSKRR